MLVTAETSHSVKFCLFKKTVWRIPLGAIITHFKRILRPSPFWRPIMRVPIMCKSRYCFRVLHEKRSVT